LPPENSKTRSKVWYLLPIFFHLIGGAIVFFVIRNDDYQKAKRCLVLGGVLLVVNLLIAFVFWDSFSKPENLFSNITSEAQIEVQFNGDNVKIELNEPGKFLAFRWDPIIIPMEDIENVNDQFPIQTISEIRNPGTYVPNTIKAGTYYTQDGDKELWFTQSGKSRILTIELKNHEFDRIVLESEKSKLWMESLREIIQNK
jgi:hypothetical protein